MESLLYFIFWGGLIFLLMRFGCGAHVMGHGHGQPGEHGKDALPNAEPLRWVPPETDVDPVCGKTVHTDRAKSAVHEGTVYYFCSRECRELFEAAPQLYPDPGADHHPRQEEHSHG
ncbi:MAG: YHS domain-containing protein [Rhodanobacter sp.]|nr:MAG: YHS domain-containing protein [Rhodanobacter sp.]